MNDHEQARYQAVKRLAPNATHEQLLRAALTSIPTDEAARYLNTGTWSGPAHRRQNVTADSLLRCLLSL